MTSAAIVPLLCIGVVAALLMAAIGAASSPADERIDDEADDDVRDAVDLRRAQIRAALARHRVADVFQPVQDLARVDDEGDVDVAEENFVPLL